MLKEKIIKELNDFKNKNCFRVLKTIDNTSVNLSSNDYMGLGTDSCLIQNFYNSAKNLPLTSSSSRLISGTYPLIEKLENKLELIYKKSGLLFNSGFDCNCCVIETFCNSDTLVISDKLNHASIHDGIIHSGATLLRYRHLDLDHLRSILVKNLEKYDTILVISETIYSMDGDCVDLKALIDLKKEFNFLLMIDEAHSFAVHSFGICHEMDSVEHVDFLTIPLGKGGASTGSYLICDQLYKDYIVNRGRKFIYTTALPPINTAWNLFILEHMNTFYNRKLKLKKLTELSHSLIEKYNMKTLSTTHIISIIIGNNSKLDKIIDHLNSKKYFVYGVKEPTVPKGTSRIRLGLSPNISENDIINFFEVLNYAINNIF